MAMKIIVIAIIVVIAAVAVYFMLGSERNISEIASSELGAYTLEKSEVKKAIGNEEVLNHQVAPTRALTQEMIDTLEQIKPSCLDKLEKGELIRTVTYFTYNRDITVVWSAENNEIDCISSVNK